MDSLRLGSLRSNAYSFIEADDVVVLAPLKGAKVPLMTIASLEIKSKGNGQTRHQAKGKLK